MLATVVNGVKRLFTVVVGCVHDAEVEHCELSSFRRTIVYDEYTRIIS